MTVKEKTDPIAVYAKLVKSPVGGWGVNQWWEGANGFFIGEEGRVEGEGGLKSGKRE